MLRTEHLNRSPSIEGFAASVAELAEADPALHNALVYGIKGFHEVEKSGHSDRISLVLAHSRRPRCAKSPHKASIDGRTATETYRVVLLECICSEDGNQLQAILVVRWTLTSQ
jgi:hypothetical protein